MRFFRFAPAFSSCLPSIGHAETPEMPRDYRGVSIRIPGIFVMPVLNALFSAKVVIARNELV
jgi:hypothetical protein